MGRPARTVEFFRVWSPAMAYILGYWWADGHMRQKSSGAYEISLASKDLDHLQRLADTVGESYHLRKVAEHKQTYVVNFCSKEMYQDLLNLGGTPRKSLIIGMPSVPDDLLAHFVRGVVDGDGTFAWDHHTPAIQIYSGSTAFLTRLGPAIESVSGIPAPNLSHNRAIMYIKWSSIRAKCLAGWLYVEHPGLALERKTIIAQQFINWQPKKTPQHGSITDVMRQKFATYLP